MSDRDPLSEIERAFDVLGDQFGVAAGTVPTDIVDQGDSFVVHAELPGYDSDDIDVQLSEGRSLTISAEHSEESETTDGRYVQRERRQQSLSRTVSLPEAVTESETAASYEDGVLTVTLPKATAADDGTSIPVN
ncbi:Hsp20/alpha crystallin family protein [Haloarcula salinisoli]|uniref:Hsp20/alpha crystallin family protein n=1 Tax=Haloarcula salinisoli TaxID=2487746 RepID=A0A8J7YNB0_9EURY|nr:Hsp20/alpha crystallin family protein [Halomicroarcula salinisoli]MBX0287012.1 Hsp20/alpha crystallin family protein [Halomicroarcula salinisoli]MBX0304313.1 Hsp20/alpha crystallin family protein [Halomicroarcula salinisoli]